MDSRVSNWKWQGRKVPLGVYFFRPPPSTVLKNVNKESSEIRRTNDVKWGMIFYGKIWDETSNNIFNFHFINVFTNFDREMILLLNAAI